MERDYAETVVTRGKGLQQDRATFDQKCADIADVMRPLRAEFRGYTQMDARRTAEIFDGTAMMAGHNLAAGLYGTMTNPSNEWCGYEAMNADLSASYRVQKWMGSVSRIGLASVGPSWSAFYAQTMELFLDLVFFGMGVMSSEMKPDLTGFIDVCRPMSECYPDADDDGTINVMFRIWKMKATNAAKRFGLENLSDEAQKKAKDGKGEIEVMHAVLPSDDYVGKVIGKGRHRFRSCYVEVDSKNVLKESGYYSFPYMVPRWSVAAGEINGRGVGELALPDTKSLNWAQKSNLNRGALMGNPPIIAPNEGVINTIRIRPGAITYGGMSMGGKPLLQPLDLSGGLPYTHDLISQMREQVKDYFFFSIMQLVGRTGMTATEIVERQEERLRLIAPYVGRVNSEFLAPFMLRRYDLLQQIHGLLPPPPQELAWQSLQVAFKSPMAMVQKSSQATAVLRAWSVVSQMAQADPAVLDHFDAVAASKIAAEGFGAPVEVWRDPEVAAQLSAQRQQQQQQQMQMQMMQSGADAAQKASGIMSAINQRLAA